MINFRYRRVVILLLCAITLLSVWGAPYAVAAKPSGVNWSELERKYEGVFVLSASRGSRKVALTFDDVPDPRFTPAVLDVLRTKKVCATFFVVGTRIVKNPAIVRRIHQEGHVVGNHSYSHPDFSKLTLSKMQEQIIRAEKAINRVVGFKPKLVRPPYGEIVPAQLEWAKERLSIGTWIPQIGDN
jgi:peptidoglycan/xylan/chitin deacetylase (PgdA/CDA1 family)